jgi:hypothetical protein
MKKDGEHICSNLWSLAAALSNGLGKQKQRSSHKGRTLFAVASVVPPTLSWIKNPVDDATGASLTLFEHNRLVFALAL